MNARDWIIASVTAKNEVLRAPWCYLSNELNQQTLESLVTTFTEYGLSSFNSVVVYIDPPFDPKTRLVLTDTEFFWIYNDGGGCCKYSDLGFFTYNTGDQNFELIFPTPKKYTLQKVPFRSSETILRSITALLNEISFFDLIKSIINILEKNEIIENLLFSGEWVIACTNIRILQSIDECSRILWPKPRPGQSTQHLMPSEPVRETYSFYYKDIKNISIEHALLYSRYGGKVIIQTVSKAHELDADIFLLEHIYNQLKYYWLRFKSN